MDIGMIIDSFVNSFQLIIAMALFFVGVGILLYDRHTKTNYLKIMARVTKVVSKSDYMYPVFEYTMPDGTERTSYSSIGYGGKVPNRLETGAEVEILVNPKSKIGDKVSTSGGVILLIIGLVIAVVGIVMFANVIPEVELNQYTVGFTALFFVIFLLKSIKLKNKFDDFKSKIDTGQEYSHRSNKSENKYGIKEEDNYGVTENDNYGINNDHDHNRTADNLMEYDSAGNLISGNKNDTGRAHIVFIILSLVMISGSVALFFEKENKIKNGISVQGRVITLERGSEGTSAAVVRFIDKSGRSNRFTDSISSNPASYRIGEEVAVIYKKNDPESAFIDRGIYNHLIPLILGGFGVLFLLIGIKKSRKKAL